MTPKKTKYIVSIWRDAESAGSEELPVVFNSADGARAYARREIDCLLREGWPDASATIETVVTETEETIH